MAGGGYFLGVVSGGGGWWWVVVGLFWVVGSVRFILGDGG